MKINPQNFSGNILRCNYILLGYLILVHRPSHKNKTAVLQNKLDKAENKLFPSTFPREIYINSLKEQLNEETNKAVRVKSSGEECFYEEVEKLSHFFFNLQKYN